MDESELEEVRRLASSLHLSVSDWVRQVLREARRDAPLKDRRRKLEAIRAAALSEFPAGDIDEMLADIERGYQVQVDS